MKMVTWGGNEVPVHTVDVQLRQCPDPDVWVCLFGLHISTAYIKLKQ